MNEPVFAISALLILFSSFASLPAAAALPHFQGDLRDFAVQFQAHVSGPEFTRENCSELQTVDQELAAVAPEAFVSTFKAGQAVPTIEAFFSAKITLRDQFRKWAKAAPLPTTCVVNVRKTFNEFRSVEDYLGLLTTDHIETGHMDPVLTGAEPVLMQNPEYARTDSSGRIALKSGDVLISRGSRLISAMIAKISTPDGLFSHGALVYVDEKTGKAYTIEAHIESGTVVKPIEEYFKAKSSRIMIFRHPDAALAHAAGKFMYDRAIKAGKHLIKYDFGMDTEDHEELYCVEVITEGYEAASKGAVKIPSFPSHLDTNNSAYLAKLGIEVEDAFAPMDMELQPEFELVAEWRQFNNIRESLLYDAMMVKVYDWMDELNYVLKPSGLMKLGKWAVWGLRKTPVLNFPVKKRFPDNMKTSVIEIILAMTKLGKGMMPAIVERSDNFFKTHNRRMSRAELLQAVEEIRNEDLTRFLEYRAWQQESLGNEAASRPAPAKPLFHKVFRPAGL